jgi:hypothetical protein
MRMHIGLLLIYKCVLGWSICYVNNLDILKMFKFHFWLFKMELYQSGADSYLIQIYKRTLKSGEFIVANSLFPAVFTTLAVFVF